MQTPDPKALAQHFRQRGEELKKDLIDQWVIAKPKFLEIFPIERILERTIADAIALDERAEAMKRPPVFFERLIESIYCRYGFFVELLRVARMPMDRRAGKVLWQETGIENSRFTLYRFRLSLREGVLPADCLRHHAEEISESIRQGDVWLVERLAEAIRETPKPSVNEWMRRAWLPLALWLDDSREAKEGVLRQAWELCKAGGLNLPPWPEPTSRNPYPVAKLLATTASKLARAKL